MKKLLLFVGVTFLSVLSLNAQTEVLQDNSLESQTPWTSTSTNFGTALCDASCGDCGGPCGPNTGAWFAWFGGAAGQAPEIGTLSQTFNVTNAGVGALSFYFKAPNNPSVLGDSLIVRFDNAIVKVITPADSSTYNTAYALVNVSLGNVSAGSHTIAFEGQEEQGTTYNALADDISIKVGTANIEEMLFDENISYSINASNQLVVSTKFNESTNMDIVVYDAAGKRVAIEKLVSATASTTVISTENFHSGTYMIDFQIENTNPISRNFIIVK